MKNIAFVSLGNQSKECADILVKSIKKNNSNCRIIQISTEKDRDVIGVDEKLIFDFNPSLFMINKFECIDLIDRKRFNNGTLKIFNDHRSLNCSHILICGPKGMCYLIGARTIKKNIPLVHIHYISDHRFFSSHINSLSGRLCWQMKVFGILVDERQLHGETVFPSIRLSLPYPRVYKSDTLKSKDIDLLYSEYQILNL